MVWQSCWKNAGSIWQDATGNYNADNQCYCAERKYKIFFFRCLCRIQQDERISESFDEELDLLQTRYGWDDEQIRKINFDEYLIKVKIANRLHAEDSKIKYANTISVNYLSWFFGFGKGKTLKQHYIDIGLESIINFEELTEKEKKRRKRGALWKAKKIAEADKRGDI